MAWQRNGASAADDAGLTRTVAPSSPQAAASSPSPTEELPTLKVGELFERGAELKPTERARSLDGKRVRLLGFMAEMELPPKGAFYLVPAPLKCDEAGGGQGDLPPESVLVSVNSVGERTLAHVPGLLEAVGRFEVGNRADAQGRTANFRLALDESTSTRALGSGAVSAALAH